MKFLSRVLSFRYEYYIVNDHGIPVYRIIKMSSNNSFLVESDGIEEFLDGKVNRRYKKIRIENNTLKKFYGSNKHWILIMGLSILSILSIVFVFFTSGWWQFILYMIFILALLIALILLLNYVENKRYTESSLAKKLI